MESLDESSRSRLGLLLAVKAGMLYVVQAYQAEADGRLSKMSFAFPLLHHASEQPLLMRLKTRLSVTRENESMIKYLLSAGCDPNESFRKRDGPAPLVTPWRLLLYQHRSGRGGSIDIVDLFVRAGADRKMGKKIVQKFTEKGPNKSMILRCVQNHESVIALMRNFEKADHGDLMRASLIPSKRSLLPQDDPLPSRSSSATGKKRARSLSPTNISKETNFGRI